jgi:hypothetical protein
MSKVTTPHGMAMQRGYRPNGGLSAFYAWAKRIGHYHASEAVERFRKIK